MQRSARRTSLPVVLGLLVLLCAAGAAVFYFRDRILKFSRAPGPSGSNALASQSAVPAPLTNTQSGPKTPAWTLELTKAVIPDAPLAGTIHGSAFACDRAALVGGLLLLGQGTEPPYDLGFGVRLDARQGEELSGKAFEFLPDQPGAPQVGWRWKNDQQQPITQIVSNGYLLKVTFGQAGNGRMPGRIFISLPDAEKSFAAGTFDAEITQPPPSRAGQPKPRH
jgi:hypothetical protein